MWRRVLSFFATMSALIIGLSALLVSYDVIARNIGLPSFVWIVDMTEYALPLATLLVAPWLALQDGHIKIDLASMFVSGRMMEKVKRLINFLCACLCFVLVWFSLSVIIESYEMGAFVIKNVVFAEWLVFTPLPVCLLLLAIEFTRRTLVHEKRSDSISN